MHPDGLQWHLRKFRLMVPSSSAGHAAGPWLCMRRMIRGVQRKGRRDGRGESGQWILAKALRVSFFFQVSTSESRSRNGGFFFFGGCVLGIECFPMNLISGALAAAACCRRDVARIVVIKVG